MVKFRVIVSFIFISLLSAFSLAQDKTEAIDAYINSLKEDTSIEKLAFDANEVFNVNYKDGSKLELWLKDDALVAIHEQLLLTEGQITTTVFLKDGRAVKVLEIEEKETLGNNEEVFIGATYILDGVQQNTQTVGERNLSGGSCECPDYKAITTLGKNLLSAYRKSSK